MAGVGIERDRSHSVVDVAEHSRGGGETGSIPVEGAGARHGERTARTWATWSKIRGTSGQWERQVRVGRDRTQIARQDSERVRLPPRKAMRAVRHYGYGNRKTDGLQHKQDRSVLPVPDGACSVQLRDAAVLRGGRVKPLQ